jgi:endonuclease YncB( thermonuclease family)
MARRRNHVVAFRRPSNRPGPRSKARGFAALMVALPLAAFTAVFFYDGPPKALAVAVPETVAAAMPAGFGPVPRHAAAPDRETAHFALCDGPVRVNCVVDGDTFWYGGAKVRIADINAPEVSEPDCPSEAALGARATDRLVTLLNQGAFTLAPNNDGSGRDQDQYGRLLRTVTRDGASVGEVLVDEGLAEEWKGYRGSWC